MLHRDGDRPLPRVFERIGQDLLHHEQQPLLIRDARCVQRLIAELQLPRDELPGKAPHGLPDDRVKIAGAQHKIAAAVRQPQIDHDHLDILLGAGKLLQKPPRLRRVLLLQA